MEWRGWKWKKRKVHISQPASSAIIVIIIHHLSHTNTATVLMLSGLSRLAITLPLSLSSFPFRPSLWGLTFHGSSSSPLPPLMPPIPVPSSPTAPQHNNTAAASEGFARPRQSPSKEPLAQMILLHSTHHIFALRCPQTHPSNFLPSSFLASSPPDSQGDTEPLYQLTFFPSFAKEEERKASHFLSPPELDEEDGIMRILLLLPPPSLLPLFPLLRLFLSLLFAKRVSAGEFHLTKRERKEERRGIPFPGRLTQGAFSDERNCSSFKEISGKISDSPYRSLSAMSFGGPECSKVVGETEERFVV